MAHNPGAIVIATLDKGDEYLLNAVAAPTQEEFTSTLASWAGFHDPAEAKDPKGIRNWRPMPGTGH